MITAKEARELSGTDVKEKVEKLEPIIKALAGKGRRSLRTGYDYIHNTELWCTGGYNVSPEWKEAQTILQSMGYKVTFFYEERQFVDMYTLIEW